MKKDSVIAPSEQKLNEVRAERDTLTQQVAQLSQALDTATAHEVLAHRENRMLRQRIDELTNALNATSETNAEAGNGG